MLVYSGHIPQFEPSASIFSHFEWLSNIYLSASMLSDFDVKDLGDAENLRERKKLNKVGPFDNTPLTN